MDDWLKIPARREGLPATRLCVIMGLTLLMLMAGQPFLAAVFR
ncbi:hypothetical protein [Neotabrizicola sp. VNH66]